MRVVVLAFATARDALGSARLEIDLPPAASLADLRRELEQSHPAVHELWDRLALAIDGELVGPEAPLAAGSEVALLPPVSGGSTPRVELVNEPIAIDELVERVRNAGRGATVLFTGNVRNHRGGRQVTHLTYEGYPPMAVRALARICREIESAHQELWLAVTHRLGRVGVSETSVAIVAAAPHRAAAFEASREVLERLKREVPIWKCEHFADGSAEWREEEPLGAAPGEKALGRGV